MTVPAVPLRQVCPHTPAEVAMLVDKALAFERDRRWQDAATMQLAVREAYQQMGQPPISTRPTLPSPVPSPIGEPLNVPADVSPFNVSSFPPSLTTSSAVVGRPRMDQQPTRSAASIVGVAIGIITSLLAVGVFLFVDDGSHATRLRAHGGLAVAQATVVDPVAARATSPSASASAAPADSSARPAETAAASAAPAVKPPPPPRPARPSSPRPPPRPKATAVDPLDVRK